MPATSSTPIAIPPAIDAALDQILHWEGARSDDPGDKGGLTVWGVSERWARDIHLDLNLDGATTRADVDLVTPAIAKMLFYNAFLVDPRINRLPEAIQPAMLQFAVNCGAARAVIELQHVLNSRRGIRLVADGVIGPATITGAQQQDEIMGDDLIRAILNAQLGWYDEIVHCHPDLVKFLRGWRNRANAFRPPVHSDTGPKA
ncbi:MAG: glycosyl hydrolase 108 family protein [Rhodospirillaceae bacterium]